MVADIQNETIEINLLLQAIFEKYGYDFRNYSRASIKRRILHRISVAGLKSISEAQHLLLYDQAFFERLLLDLTVNVSEMFRDPSFFGAIREIVIPYLRQLPFFKIWHAGCSEGEEVYSMAILLAEENLLDRARIYATDNNEAILAKAKKGIYPIEKMKLYTSNYNNAGGTASFADYFSADDEHVIMDQSLKTNVVFSDHNLATDGVFGEMDLILCRNVLIYFNSDLQNRVLNLFKESLSPEGFLCLGSKESIRFMTDSDSFEDIIDSERIYRKKLA